MRVRTVLKAIFVAMLALAVLSPSPAEAEKKKKWIFPVGLPASTWGNITNDNDDVGGNSVLYNVKQGVDWYRFSNGIVFNTYATYKHRSRENNPIYFDAEGPAVGAQLEWGPVSFGYEYYEERAPKRQLTSYNSELFAVGYWSYDIAKYLGVTNWKLPGAVWASGSYDNQGLYGSGVMGWVNQGIDLYEWGPFTLNAYVEYKFRTREKEPKYYDANGPLVGIEIQHEWFKFGVDYYHENLPALRETSARAQVYFGWYITHDWLD